MVLDLRADLVVLTLRRTTIVGNPPCTPILLCNSIPSLPLPPPKPSTHSPYLPPQDFLETTEAYIAELGQKVAANRVEALQR